MTYTAVYDNNNPAPNLCRPFLSHHNYIHIFLYYFKNTVPGVIRFTICIDLSSVIITIFIGCLYYFKNPGPGVIKFTIL